MRCCLLYLEYFLTYRVGHGPCGPISPLRTVLDSFPSYGSSISKSCSCGATRLFYLNSLCDTHLQSDLPSCSFPYYCHLIASPTGAPGLISVICVPVSEDSSNALATKHLLEVITPFRIKNRFLTF